MMDHDHQPVQEALGAYALNALGRAEQEAIARHLDECEACSALYVEVKTIVGVLPYALPPQLPVPEMKTRLLAAARAEKRTATATPVSAPAPSWWETLMAALRPLRRVAMPLALVLLIGWNVYLQQQLGALQNSRSMMDLARVPTGVVIPLIGSGVPEATARLYLAENQQEGVLAVRGLPPLPGDRVYQLWFAHPDNPTRTGGAFLVNNLGEAVVGIDVPYPLETVSAIAITEEPAPRSDSPTGAHLLDGEPGR